MRRLGCLVCLFQRGQMPTVGQCFLFRCARRRFLETGDIGVSSDNSSDTAVRHPFDRSTPAQYPHPMSVAVPLSVLERILLLLPGILAISLVGDTLPVLWMHPGQPCFSGRVHPLVGTNATHLAPHR